MGRTIIIVGGALSGPTAASRARELDDRARIVLIQRSRDISYAVCGLAYVVSGEVDSLAELDRQRARFFQEVYNVEVYTNTEVLGIEPAQCRIKLRSGELRYDSLIYAAGAKSRPPDIPELSDGAQNVRQFRTLKDLEVIARRLRRGAHRIAVIGGGFAGVEAADGFMRAGCRVTLIEPGRQLLPQLSKEVASVAAQSLQRNGVQVLTSARITEAKRSRKGVSVLRLDGGEKVKTDLVIVTTKLAPRSGLLRRAGAQLHPDGTISIDERCATSLPQVFACGGCVSVPHALTHEPVWQPRAVVADKTARVAAASAVGQRAKLEPILGTAIVRAGSLVIARTGLTRGEAAELAGPKLASARIHAPARDVFFPGATQLTTILYYHRDSGALLGAEAVGQEGVDKRIDVLAAALTGALTVEQLAGLDLAYAPPFSATRDPINMLGSVASESRQLSITWTPAALAAERAKVTVIEIGARRKPAGVIAGSLRLTLPQLRKQLSSLPPKQPVVFVSADGRLGYVAAHMARQRGLSGAGYLSGGLQSWTAAGYAERAAKGLA